MEGKKKVILRKETERYWKESRVKRDMGERRRRGEWVRSKMEGELSGCRRVFSRFPPPESNRLRLLFREESRSDGGWRGPLDENQPAWACTGNLPRSRKRRALLPPNDETFLIAVAPRTKIGDGNDVSSRTRDDISRRLSLFRFLSFFLSFHFSQIAGNWIERKRSFTLR